MEALIYSGLFAFIMSGAILSAYQIFEGSAQVQVMAERETELNFVLRKLDWALNGATDVQVLSSGDELQIVRDAGITYVFSTDGTAVQIERVGDDTYDLSSPRLAISDLAFDLDTAADPDILEITMTVDGDTVGPVTKYIR